jgi:antitoxin component YwqK of YwqJK toxin-antitoxin module
MKTEVSFETRKDRILSHRKEFYADGTLFREGHYSKGNGSWGWDVPSGPVKTFHKNGILKSDENYDEGGTLEGESKFYDQEGKIHLKVIYRSGIKINETDYSKIKNHP